MKKFTYNATAGITYSFPSCKTFVFLRSDHDVSFKFISLWNKIDKEIEGFKDSFSITAKDYFLQVRVVSSTNQEISAILIDDDKINYQPIMGEVTIANTPLPVNINNSLLSVDIDNVPLPVEITNTSTNVTVDNEVGVMIANSGLSINETVPVLQPAGQVLHINKGANLDASPTAYTNYLLEHFFSSYISPVAHATNVHACSVNGASGISEPGKLCYLTEIKMIPSVNCNLCIYLFATSGSDAHGYSTSVYENFYKNIVKNNSVTPYCRLLKKTVPFSDITGTDILYEKIPVIAGEQKIVKFETPILVDSRTSFGITPYGYCTICTDIPAQYDIFLKTKYYKSEYLIPKTFV
jgi:hypothetical protein